MREDTVVQLRQPGSFEDDPLTEVLRLGARRLLGQAVEAEVAGFVEAYAHLTDSAGRRRIVRHGHLPEREIQTGIGPVAVRCPRVRDRGAGETGPRVRFTSRILPPYLRRAKSIEELLPWLYLKGISTGDFCEALAALLGPEAPGLSASTIARLKEVWQGELEHWQRRDLSAKRYVYFWADGVYFSPRLDHDKQCMCVIIGADELGRKELLAIADGYRESAQSWREVLLDLKRRGLAIAPELATGDGALGPRNKAGSSPRQRRRNRPRSAPTASGHKTHDPESAASPTSSPSGPPDQPSAVPSPSPNPPANQGTRESDGADLINGLLKATLVGRSSTAGAQDPPDRQVWRGLRSPSWEGCPQWRQHSFQTRTTPNAPAVSTLGGGTTLPCNVAGIGQSLCAGALFDEGGQLVHAARRSRPVLRPRLQRVPLRQRLRRGRQHGRTALGGQRHPRPPRRHRHRNAADAPPRLADDPGRHGHLAEPK